MMNQQLFSFPDDHTRVKLKTEVNPNKQDYINASIIVRTSSNISGPPHGESSSDTIRRCCMNNRTFVCSISNTNLKRLCCLSHQQFDHDPRQPSYIATQGPLPHTVADFWQVSTVFSFYSLILSHSHSLLSLLSKSEAIKRWEPLSHSVQQDDHQMSQVY